MNKGEPISRNLSSATLTECERFPIVIRPMGAGDEPLLYSSWINSMWDQQRKLAGSVRPMLWGGASKDLFCAELHTAIEQISTAPETVRLSACVPEYPDQVVGVVVASSGKIHFAAGSRSAIKLHWLYVRGEKPGFRRLGVGRQLLDAALLLASSKGEANDPLRLYTQHTPFMAHLAPKWKLMFDPLGLQV